MIVTINGYKPEYDENSFIAPNAALAGRIKLSKGVSVWFNVSARAEYADIFVDENTSIQDNAVLHVGPDHPLNIGKNVTVGHNAILHGCTVEDNVTVGMGAIVLNGAKIGEGSIIGAGSLIPQGKEIPPRSLVVGVPGKVIKQLDDKAVEGNLQNAKSYVKNGEIYSQATIEDK